MKLFCVALLVAAASAQPFLYQGVVPTTYHAGFAAPGYSPFVNTYMHGVTPSVYGMAPSVYGVPAIATHPMVQPKSEVDQEMNAKVYSAVPEMKKQEEMKPMMKEMPKQEQMVKPIAYNVPTPFGYQPVIPVEYNVERPARFHQKNGKIENTVYKRSADAEPMYPFATPIASTYMNTYPAVQHAAIPATYMNTFPAVQHAALPAPYMNAFPAVHHTGYPMLGHPMTYGAGVLPVVNQPIIKPVPKVTFTKPVVDTAQKTIANDVITPFGYAGKGTYKAETPGTAHYAKRDADADSDAYLAYGSAYYPSSVYSGYRSAYSPFSTYRTPFVSSPYNNFYGNYHY